MIMSATCALQIVNDLDHAAKDLAVGNRTWVHNLLGLHAGASLTRGRFIGGMDRVLDQMRDRLAEVGGLADRLGVPEAAGWAETTKRAATDRFERLLLSLLERPRQAADLASCNRRVEGTWTRNLDTPMGFRGGGTWEPRWDSRISEGFRRKVFGKVIKSRSSARTCSPKVPTSSYGFWTGNASDI